MRSIFLGIFIMVSGHAFANSPLEEYDLGEATLLELFVRPDMDNIDASQYATFRANYETLIDELKAKQKSSKSESAFLKQVFYTVHKKMLGHYQQYVSFNKLLEDQQQYDCVTGTALYAIILYELGYQYDIHETDYHVYLVAKTANKSYLFESTDPLNGFAWRPNEIAVREAYVNKKSLGINSKLILNGVSTADADQQEATYINNIVDLKALSGLHYYNQALRHFNNGNYRDAHRMIVIAQGLHPTDRIQYAASYFFAMAFED